MPPSVPADDAAEGADAEFVGQGLATSGRYRKQIDFIWAAVNRALPLRSPTTRRARSMASRNRRQGAQELMMASVRSSGGAGIVVVTSWR